MANKTSLADALRAIDRQLADLPEVARSLRKPASAAKLATCARKLGLKALPDDLIAWFRWHDGQTDALAPGLDPESPAITFMPIDAALAERARLISEPEKMLPWADSWFPIAENGGGDCYVYVTAGKRAGAILFYLHDDPSRSVVAKTLTAFAIRLASRLEARKRASGTARFGELVEPLVDVPQPTVEELKRAPIGTMYYVRAQFYEIYVKVTNSQWMLAKDLDLWAGEGAKFTPPPGMTVDEYRIAAAIERVKKRTTLSDWRAKPEEMSHRLRVRDDGEPNPFLRRGRIAGA